MTNNDPTAEADAEQDSASQTAGLAIEQMMKKPT
jgi:hypothetical protein